MKVFTYSNEKLVGIGILVLRIGLGVIMFAHGSQKVLGAFGGKGLDATVAGMSTGLGIPPFLAYLAAFTEFLGGIGLIVGLLTRFFGISVLITMLVAVLGVHAKNGLLGPGGFEYPGMLAMAALAISIVGPGLYSLDHVIFSSGPKLLQVDKIHPTGKTSFNPLVKGV